MPSSEITISQYSANPPIQLPEGYTTLEVRRYYNANFIAADGVTPVMASFTNGQSGFFYSTTPTVNGSGDLVVPAHLVQPTTESNPSARYFEDLWVDGAFYQRLMPNTNVSSGWQIPTVYGDPIAFDEIATYNRAQQLVYAPTSYFTADQTILEARRIAGGLNYAGVGILGRTELDTAPDIASVPIAVGINSPLLYDNSRLIPATNVLTPQLYGAFADGTIHAITSQDITDNPQWIGSYTVGDSWDSVGMQEALYAALATNSTPGNPAWNAEGGDSTDDRPIYWPNGSYYINRQVETIAEGFKFYGAGRKAAVLNWYGPDDEPMWFCNAVSYGTFGEMGLLDQVGTDQALLEIDWDGTSTSLASQQLTLANMDFDGNHLGDHPLRISKSGASAQGDTIFLPNILLIGGKKAGLAIGFSNAQNALGILAPGGDCQGNFKDGISVTGGQVFVQGMSFQNQDQGTLSADGIVLSQVSQGGADLHVYSTGGISGLSSLQDIRSESDVLSIGGPTHIRHAAVVGASQDQWVASSYYNLGQLIKGTPGAGQKGVNGRTFMLVDQGVAVTDFATPSGTSHYDATNATTNTIIDLTQTWTVNQWVGFYAVMRYPNGFVAAPVQIVSNTATTLNLVTHFQFDFHTCANQVCTAACSLPAQAYPCSQYKISGITGSTEPTWSSAAVGFYNGQLASTGAGWSITSGTNVINSNFYGFGSAYRDPAVGDYIMVVGAGTGGGPFISRVTAFSHPTGSTARVTVANNAPTTVTDSTGYISTPITDGDVKWIDIDFSVVQNAGTVVDLYANGGKVQGSFSNGSGGATSLTDSIFARPDFMCTPYQTVDNVVVRWAKNCSYGAGTYSTDPITYVPDFVIPGANVASANTIVPTGNSFSITGTTTIKTITTTELSVGVTLLMKTISAVTFDETGNLRINGAATTLTTTAGDIVIGYWDGTLVQIR